MGDFFDRFSRVPLSQKVLLLFLILAAIFIGFYMFLFSPLEDEIAERQEVQAALNQDRVRVAHLEVELEEKQRVLQDERARRQGDSVDLPRHDDVAVLIRELENIALNQVHPSPTGPLQFLNVRRDPYVAEGDYTRMPIQLSLYGTFDQALEFCWELAEMDERILHVRAITLAPESANQPGAPMLRISLSIEAFYRPEG